jgi:3-isopropylmalate/(R)-2-methylmalate dehydratase large subunit
MGCIGGTMTIQWPTLVDKLWDAHTITTRADGQSLLFIDRHFLHEGAFHAFNGHCHVN